MISEPDPELRRLHRALLRQFLSRWFHYASLTPIRTQSVKIDGYSVKKPVGSQDVAEFRAWLALCRLQQLGAIGVTRADARMA
jgi:hypothetical protein